jgi:DNA phosphorothioation-dependent restriction protein DptH
MTMVWTELHARLLANAFEKVLGRADPGAMAFVRCLTPDVVEALAGDTTFAPSAWKVWRVADAADARGRTITADQAVELRESKGEPVLLLVDTARAGAGMDGIYSAAQEVDEPSLFNQTLRLAGNEVASRLSRETRVHAERAIKKARGFGHRFSLSPWTEFDFLVRIAKARRHPGELLYLLGLWPVKQDDEADSDSGLNVSRLFVDRLLGTAVAGLTPAQRIEALKLLNPSEEQITDLERFLRSAATKPLLPALAELADKTHLWINALRIEGAVQIIQGIELVPWRTNTGRIAKWSGLIDGPDVGEPPVLVLNPDADKTGDYSKLEVRWKARPDNLAKGAVEYRVAIATDMDEELASREVPHAGRKEEKCRFTNDDFSMLSDDALIGAKVVVSVIGNDQVEPQESEEFTIRFGKPPEHEPAGVGKKVRTFSEGLIELDDRETVSALAASTETFPVDSKGFVLLRTPQRGRSFRVFRPSLIREVEQQWAERSGAIGRWRVRVRASGARTAEPEFVPSPAPESSSGTSGQSLRDRVSNASRRMAERFAACSGVGQIYDEKSKAFDTVVKEYLLAWAALLEEGDPPLALANTVEVQTLSGRTIGLIVLPSHPLRVAWHVAYDNLVLHAKFEQGARPKDIRDEFLVLDGAMFPAFLPGLEGGGSFVFADTLGFHAVGMVPDYDKEPKAAVAILARALGESETADTVPTVGKQSAQVLGNEILKYIECHDTSKLLHLHALRPGDGLTVARSLGRVQERYRQATPEEDLDESEHKVAPAFVLELYPSHEQRGVAGRFIAEAREKRRTGAGVLSAEDRWMLESLSLSGGMNLPKLRWARKSAQDPKTPAHIAVAFDTFESRVVSDRSAPRTRPLFAYGVLSFFEREYTSVPSPLWRSTVVASADGEKHPSDRTHTERLIRLQQVIGRCVARSIADDAQAPTLRTEISPEKAHSLRELHRLCDWVITLDRNAGIEYFDSPRDNREVYDAYVIDCVPEREDLGCLQLITSTSNLEEVRNLLDGALDQMGLSRSRRNAEFLMEHLKALSGRLAIRLTGQKAPTSELIALALCHASCRQAREEGDCWTSLGTGFVIPVDDVLDLIPPLSARETDEEAPEAGSSAGTARPDLIYVSVVPRKGLSFQFIEVKYRRHLRAARSVDTLEGIRQQVQSLRKRWDEWYSSEDICPSFRAVRRAKLARVLRFYADKADRHYLAKDRYENIVAEIDRMIEKGGEYSFAAAEIVDRGWVFCPEYAGVAPLEVSPPGWETRIFLFGPGLLPDSDFRGERPIAPATVGRNDETTSAKPDSGEPERPIGTPGGPRESSAAQPTSSQVESLANAATDGSQGDSQTQTASSPDVALNEKKDDRSVCLGTDLLTGSEVRWPLTVRGNPHLLVAGLPGMGKTTCLLNLCKQMLDAGIRPIVFSYHQDIDERLERLVAAVRFLDYQGLGFNPLQVIARQSRMAYLDVAGALRDIFVAIFPELGDIQGERIRKAIKESFVERGWDDPNADLPELPEPPFRRFVEILRAEPKPDRGLRTLLGRLEELDDYGFFDLAESHESLWESEQPIVLRIHTTQNDNLQKAFASLVFYGLYKDMFRRGTRQRITHAVVFDEAHRAARLRLIPTMAKECRKYGISLVLASQEAKDFNISLFSAIANYLVLRLNEADAKALVRNVASSDQERALIDKIKQMERFKALYFCEGRKKPAPVSLLP